MRRSSSLARAARSGWLGLLLCLSGVAAAQNPVDFSPDITADLGSFAPSLVSHSNVANDDSAGSVAVLPPMSIPSNVDVIAMEPLAGGETLLSFDTTVALPGLLPAFPAEPRDVVRFDPSTGSFAMMFDGSLNGVPSNVRVDAVAVNESDELLLSFDTTVSLLPVGAVFDEDLVKFAAGAFSMEYDGSANGIASSLDLDAASKRLGTDELVLSFDGTGSATGVIFDDEDAVAFDTTLLTYSMWFDASISDPTDWPAVDLIAIPEPDAPTILASGLALLAGLASRRRAGRSSRRPDATR